MPEYPDITLYIERLRYFLNDSYCRGIRLGNPFILRTATPPVNSISGQKIEDIFNIGKRIVFEFSGEYFLLLHLMISGRLVWGKNDIKIPPKRGLAALDFENGSLLITESATQKRASLHLIHGKADLSAFDRGGRDVFEIDLQTFKNILQSENHTLKRCLTDPRLFSGIGNAYSDEILFKARLSPILLSQKMNDEQVNQLFNACRASLSEWTERLRNETGDGFPKKVTAFRPEMSVHGKYGKSCPECGQKVQRIRYASNETNYCPGCQTSGKLLADRSLSRLLKSDWPRTPEALEEHLQQAKR